MVKEFNKQIADAAVDGARAAAEPTGKMDEKSKNKDEVCKLLQHWE